MFVVIIVSRGFVVHLPEMPSFLIETYQIPARSSKPTRGHFHPPSSPLASRAPRLIPLYGSLCWIVNLRALSPQKRSWHEVGRQPVKAWKSKWLWRNSSVNFIQLISSNGRKWVEANEWAVTPTNSEFKKLARKRRVIFFTFVCL